MERDIIFFMKKDIKKKGIDIDKMALEDPEKAIKYIHRQYRLAEKAMNKSQSLCREVNASLEHIAM